MAWRGTWGTGDPWEDPPRTERSNAFWPVVLPKSHVQCEIGVPKLQRGSRVSVWHSQ